MAERVLDVGALIESRPIGPAQWTVIGLCAFVAMLDGLDLQSIGLAAPAMIAQLHVAPHIFGFVFSAALAGLALGAFLLGRGLARIGTGEHVLEHVDPGQPLVEDDARPSIFFPRSGICRYPYMKGQVASVNGNYNNWRMEDVWLDR